MRKSSTYKELYSISQEFHMMQAMCPNAYNLFHGKISDFRTKNKTELEKIKKSVTDIYDQHIEKENGEYLQEKGAWTFKSAQDSVDFESKIDSLMKTNCIIIL